MKTRNYSLQQRIDRTEAVYHALGEAAYEGNIGAVEVAQFYMNADDNQIQEFEAELDNGNETEAWDIVQRFHGVDLVGIGSDQPSPRAERVAGQIDEYFNKKNNKKALTYEFLYEMIQEEINKTTDLRKIMDSLVASIKSEKGYEATLDLKKRDMPTISGLDRNQRIEIAKNDWLLNRAREIVPAYAKASVVFRKKKDELDIPERLDIEGVGRIYIKQGSSYKPGGVQLEQAVVDALNGAKPKYFSEFANNLKYSKHQFGKAVKLDGGPITKDWKDWGGADTTSKADILIGEKDGVSMKMGANAMLFGFGPGDARACMAAALASFPPEQFATNSEVRNLEEALRTMGSAIGRAPLGTLKKARKLKDDDSFRNAPDADSALAIAAGETGYDWNANARTELGKTISKAKEGDEKALDRIRGHIRNGVFLVNGESGDKAAAGYELGDTLEPAGKLTKDQEKDQNYKIKHDSVKSQGKQNMSKIQTVEQLIAHAEEIEKLEIAMKKIEKLSISVMSPDSNKELRFAYFKEALTGSRKFGQGSKNVATHMFVTQEDSTFPKITQGQGSNIDNFFVYESLEDDATIIKIMNAANFRGKFRSDGIKKKVGSAQRRTGFNLYRSSLIAEIKTSTDGGKKYLDKFRGLMSEALQEGLITKDQYAELITEGLLGDIASSVVGGIKSAAATAAEKGGEILSSWTKKISDVFSGMVDWFKGMYERVSAIVKQLFRGFQDAIDGGMESFLGFMGLSTAELVEEFEPGGDANGDEQTNAFLTLFSS